MVATIHGRYSCCRLLPPACRRACFPLPVVPVVVRPLQHQQDPVKEIASLQLLQGSDESAAGAAGGGHHGVEELIEALTDDTTLYKISPWYSGGELFDLAPMSEDVAKPIFSQILDAVSFVHSKGVCMIRRHDVVLNDVCRCIWYSVVVSLVCSSGAFVFPLASGGIIQHSPSAVLSPFWGARCRRLPRVFVFCFVASARR